MDGFRKFSSHWFGAFVILILAVNAGIIAEKMLVSRFPDSGIPGAFKSAIMMV